MQGLNPLPELVGAPWLMAPRNAGCVIVDALEVQLSEVVETGHCVAWECYNKWDHS